MAIIHIVHNIEIFSSSQKGPLLGNRGPELQLKAKSSLHCFLKAHKPGMDHKESVTLYDLCYLYEISVATGFIGQSFIYRLPMAAFTL